MPSLCTRRQCAGSHRRQLLGSLLAVACATACATDSQRPSPLKSGLDFASADIRSMQADEFANPGMLWVARGEKLWSTPPAADAKPCSSCHGDAAGTMKGVATRYPTMDTRDVTLVNLEGRINLCRTRHQQVEPLKLESEELLSLAAYVGRQSRDMASAVVIDDSNRKHFERGRETYFRRVGQMNLACTHCHDRNWGRQLLSQTISQGHGHAYPAYRLEWQAVGSLQRRLRACYFGVRAQMPEYGSARLVELELYLAWRGAGLPVETPGVRR